MDEVRPVERGMCSDGPIRLLPQWDEPDAVTIETTPRTPAASEAFSESELAARLEAIAARVEAEEPSRSKVTEKRCWGCGAMPPASEHGGLKMPSKTPGWVVRQISARFKAPETWCPECAKALDRMGPEEPE